MKSKGYSEEFKEQVLKEIEETSNMTLVARNHNIPSTTINTRVRKQKNGAKVGSTMDPKSSNFSSNSYNKDFKKENDFIEEKTW